MAQLSSAAIPANMSPSVTRLMFVDADGRSRVCDVDASLPGSAIVAGLPVRSFSAWPGKRNYEGAWWSSTTRTLLPFESLLEEQALLLYDFEHSVSWIAVQPFALLWPRSQSRGPRHHVPDLLLGLVDGGYRVVDVRPAALIDERAADQFERTGEVLVRSGWSYQVFHGLSEPRLSNLRFLAGFRQDRYAVDEAREATIRSLIGPGCTVESCVERVSTRTGWSWSSSLATVNHLLWRQSLRTDLDALLGTNSWVSS